MRFSNLVTVAFRSRERPGLVMCSLGVPGRVATTLRTPFGPVQFVLVVLADGSEGTAFRLPNPAMYQIGRAHV